jgi:hypothetical protein
VDNHHKHSDIDRVNSARENISYNYILPLLDEIRTFLMSEEAEKLYRELALVV